MSVPVDVGAESCFHGGAFFDAVGDEFVDLSRRFEIVNADVLDAWFPPAPRVVQVLAEHLPWLLATSPPTNCAGMARVLARARDVPEANILPGAGSSALIFLAFTRWLRPDSRVVLLDPTYGEYRHVLENVVGCDVRRMTLARENGYRFDPDHLVGAVGAVPADCDLVVIVNPNSPTGQHVPRDALIAAIRRLPDGTRVWIDETYVEYAGTDQSLERFAAASRGVVVCKSMSKVYALSGARAAYLCAGPELLATLRPFVPPWAVSLPAQIAAVEAMRDPDYYATRYRETHALREALCHSLRALPGIEPTNGVANFVLCHLASAGPTAAEVVRRCRVEGVFLRDASGMGTTMGRRALRIAVKDAAANRRIVSVLARALH
jgi:histidinol-phosphate/aromatic aminotransferase/cobyric acid decarboxylase-like protein